MESTNPPRSAISVATRKRRQVPTESHRGSVTMKSSLNRRPTSRSIAAHSAIDDTMPMREDAKEAPPLETDRPNQQSVILSTGSRYSGLLWNQNAEERRLYGPYVHKAPAIADVICNHGWTLVDFPEWDDIPLDESKNEPSLLSEIDIGPLKRASLKCCICTRALTKGKCAVMSDGWRYALFKQYPFHIDCLVRYFESNAIYTDRGLVLHLDGYLPCYPVELAPINHSGYVKSLSVNPTNANYRGLLIRRINRGLPRIANPKRLSVRERLDRIVQFSFFSPLNSSKSCVPTTVGGTLSIGFFGECRDKRKKNHPTRWVDQKRNLIRESHLISSDLSRVHEKIQPLERNLAALMEELKHYRMKRTRLAARLKSIKEQLGDKDEEEKKEEPVPMTDHDNGIDNSHSHSSLTVVVERQIKVESEDEDEDVAATLHPIQSSRMIPEHEPKNKKRRTVL